MGDDPKIVAGRKCLKCDENAKYYSNNPKQAVYCKNCYLSMILHKFSYVFGNNRVFKDGNKKDVILFYRLNNLADEYMIETVKSESTGVRPKLPANSQVLVILESTVDEELSKEYLNYKKKEQSFGISWPWKYTHFVEVFKEEISFYDDIPVIQQEEKKMMNNLFKKSTAKSDRNELKRLLLDLLLFKVASKSNVDKVLIGDTLEFVAQTVFNGLCFGRGASISQLSAGVDKRYPGLSIIRPLREIYEADIQLVMKLKRNVDDLLNDLNINQVEIKKRSTVQDFNFYELTRLQNNGFASTLTNVSQTAIKVKPPFNSEAIHTCNLCFVNTEFQTYCGSCNRLFEAIPNFPEEIKQKLIISTLI